MYASSSAHQPIYLHQGQPAPFSHDYLDDMPARDLAVRLRRKVKRKRERMLIDPADSSEESDFESVASGEQRSRSTSSEPQQAFDVHNENSNSSSVASNDSTCTKGIRRRRKILVTEEKMADALRELHLDLKMFDAANLHSLLQQRQEPVESEMTDTAPKSSDISFVDFEDDEEDEDAESTLVLSDELKETLKLFDEQRAKEIKKFLATVQLSKRSENLTCADKMQLVPYKSSPVITVLAESSSGGMEAEPIPDISSPFKRSRSILATQNPNTLDSDSARTYMLVSDMPQCPYQVEEPIEKYLEKQSLKRTYSQISKISIEELGSAIRPSTVVTQEEPTHGRAAYYVDEDPSESSHLNCVNDAAAYRQGDSNNNIRFKISEITDEAEQMEL